MKFNDHVISCHYGTSFDLYDTTNRQMPYQKDLYSRNSSRKVCRYNELIPKPHSPPGAGAFSPAHYVKMHSALVLILLFSLAAAMQPVENSIFDSKASLVGVRTPARP